MGAVQVKGKNEATKVYELASSNVKPRHVAQIFSNATELYMTGMFTDALKLYKEYLKHRPNDYATLKKIEECSHAPSSNEKWDGVVRMHDK
jgi:TolA-binding protein